MRSASGNNAIVCDCDCWTRRSGGTESPRSKCHRSPHIKSGISSLRVSSRNKIRDTDTHKLSLDDRDADSPLDYRNAEALAFPRSDVKIIGRTDNPSGDYSRFSDLSENMFDRVGRASRIADGRLTKEF